jgi:homotetrameric cytidine deaminase/rRNA maturation RNase YbeY
MIKMHLEVIIAADDVPNHLADMLSRVADCCVSAEGIRHPCVASVILTDAAQIRKINRERRNIDSETDVLSFPAIAYPPYKTARNVPDLLRSEWDDHWNACMLGDIVISVPRAALQARQYGHSTERELSYLLAHGLFHLMGYDHLDEKEKALMREMEEYALAMAGQPRSSDQELLASARESLKNAYAPYSGFRVGASILSKDGRVFTGCNVENASYGLTNCAERTAIFKAVSEGVTQFDTIAIASEKAAPWPCGACRQVLNEFCPNLRVLVTGNEGQVEETFLNELLPHGFGPDSVTLGFLGKDKL